MNRILATALALILAALGGYTAGHMRGAHIERQAQAAREGRALAQAIERATIAARELAAIGTQLRDAIAASHERERVVIKTVTEVIRENPEFAAVRRPRELDRLRQAQLQAIADATADVPR